MHFSIRHGSRKYLHLDYFNLIHTWVFFAPHPPKYSYYILFREKTSEITTPFKVLNTYKRPFYSFIFNPASRVARVFATAAPQFVNVDVSNPDNIRTSFKYLVILSACLEAATLPNSEVQFAIVRIPCGNNGPAQFIFSSDLHAAE